MLDSTPSHPRAPARPSSALRLTRAALQTAFALSDDLGGRLAERLFVTPRRRPRPERERALLAGARELAIDVTLRSPRWQLAHRTIRAWRWGSGPAVLLVHGWEGRGAQLGGLVAPLVDAGLSVITFDAPGHGDSPARRFYVTDLADCIADVAAAVGPLHGLVAHSLGAAAALLARVRNQVEAPRNVLLAPSVAIADAIDRFAHTVGLDPVDREALERRLGASTGFTPDALSIERLTRAADAELLVVHDRDDREASLTHARRLVAAWPGAQLEVTDGLGHHRILRDPAVIARAVAFLGDDVAAPRSSLVREIDRALTSRA